jgi:hypothetical protein
MCSLGPCTTPPNLAVVYWKANVNFNVELVVKNVDCDTWLERQGRKNIT